MSLSQNSVNKLIEIHFKDKAKYNKECRETYSVWKQILSDYTNYGQNANHRPCVLNLACGNSIGAENFHDYFPNHNLIGVDINKYQCAEFYHQNGFLHLLQQDLYKPDTSFINIMKETNIWMSIHACGKLAIQIITLFESYAPNNSKLYLIPCCHHQKKRELKYSIGKDVWDKLVQEEKRNKLNKTIWIHTVMDQARSMLLEKQSKHFLYTKQLVDIPSIHNILFVYEKK